MAVEIERKFLLAPIDVERILDKKSLPYKKIYIEQFYLSSKRDGVKRYRRVEDSFVCTIKRGFGLIREEFEKNIAKSEYLKSRKKHKKKLIKKLRYLIDYEGHTLEIDKFEASLDGLVVLEVEFDSMSASKEYTLPKFLKPYLIEEVTANVEFTNGHLSKNLKIPTIKYNLPKAFNVVKKQNHLKASVNIKIPHYQSIQDSIKIIAYSLALSLKANREAIISGSGDEVERLHQFRVASRKLKVLLSSFREFFDKSWVDKRIKEVSSSLKATNQQRDIDIFLINLDRITDLSDDKISEMIEYIFIYIEHNEEFFDDLYRYIQNIHKKAKKRTIKRLKDERLSKEIIKLKNLKKFKKSSSIPTFLAVDILLREMGREIKRLISKVSSQKPPLSQRDLHTLRIEFKKLRYLIEFFRSSITNIDIDTTLKSLKRLQDEIGDIRDLHIEIEYLKRYKNLNPKDEYLDDLNGALEFFQDLQEIKERFLLIEIEKFNLF